MTLAPGQKSIRSLANEPQSSQRIRLTWTQIIVFLNQSVSHELGETGWFDEYLYAWNHSRDNSDGKLWGRHNNTRFVLCVRSFCTGIHRCLEYGKECWLSLVFGCLIVKKPTANQQPAPSQPFLNTADGSLFGSDNKFKSTGKVTRNFGSFRRVLFSMC